MRPLSANSKPSQPVARWIPLALAAAGLLVHPAGWLLSRLLWPRDGGTFGTLGSYLFGTAFGGAPLLFFAGTLELTRREAESHPALRAALRTGAVALPLLLLLAQVLAWRDVGSDAQGGLLFLFLPIYAAFASFLLMVLAFVLRLAVRLVFRR